MVQLLYLIGLTAVIAVPPGSGMMQSPTWFPSARSRWHLTETTTFDRTNLFEHIDGAAEVYLAYGFDRVWIGLYRAEGEPDIAVEAYDMGSSADAYGVLSIDLTGEHVEVGGVARYGAGLLRYCKAQWFVRVLAEKETADTRAAVLELGTAVASAIDGESETPAALRLLPAQGLVPDTETYFHTAMTLAQLYFLSVDNILHLSPDTEAVTAEYVRTDREARLLVIRYPSPAEGLAAYRSFVSEYLEAAETDAGSAIAQVEDGSWASARTVGRHLIIVVAAPDAEMAAELSVGTVHCIEGDNDGSG